MSGAKRLPSLAAQLRGLLQTQQQSLAAATASTVRSYSSELAIRGLDAVKAGPGGRSSVSGVTATIFGSSGFLARYVANAIGRLGSQLVMPYRCDEVDVQHLRNMGDLGQVVLLPDFSIRDEEFVRKAIARSNVVINCISADRDTWNYGFEEVHTEWPARLAKAVKEHGNIQRFIHFSAIGASPDAPSRRLRTKAAGEEIVRTELGPISTIFKLAHLTGTEDRLFNAYAKMAKALPFVPLVDGGHTRMQPVWVRDVVSGVMNSLKTYDSLGQTYQFAGPDVFTVRELVSFTFDTIRERNSGVPTPAMLARLAARPGDYLALKTPLRGNPMFSADYVNEMESGDFTMPPGVLGFSQLDVTPHRVTEGIPIEYLRFYRSGGYDFGATAAPEASSGGGGFGHPGSSIGQNA